MHIENKSTIEEGDLGRILVATKNGEYLKVTGRCPKIVITSVQQSERCPGVACEKCHFFRDTQRLTKDVIDESVSGDLGNENTSRFVEADMSVPGAAVYKIWEVQETRISLVDLRKKRHIHNTKDVAQPKVASTIEFAQFDQDTDRGRNIFTKKGDYVITTKPY